MLHLEKVTQENLVRIEKGLAEIAVHPTPFDIQAVQNMLDYRKKNFDGYLDELKQNEIKHRIEGYSPDTVLLLFDDDKFIGVYNIRHTLTPYLLQTGGHIAYQIIPSERRKGYVKAGLKLVLDWCWKELGIEQALLFCNQENIGSDKAMSSVMLEMGGSRVPDKKMDGHIERGVWINTQKVKC